MPHCRKLHNDPRWAEFLQAVGSAPEQLDAIEFNVTLPNPDKDGPTLLAKPRE